MADSTLVDLAKLRRTNKYVRRAYAMALIDELAEMRERVAYGGHTKACMFTKQSSCSCGAHRLVNQLRAALEASR